jgi:hypothetical protein
MAARLDSAIPISSFDFTVHLRDESNGTCIMPTL